MIAVPFTDGCPAAQVDRSLRRSLVAMDEAKKCAVLWFGEVMRRKLFREFGCSSIQQYAVERLEFSRSKTRDFVHLARKLEELPDVKDAVESGELGYTKAREVAKVATPAPMTREVPVRFSCGFTPEQEARRAALVERLHKLGAAPQDRAELLLDALAALVAAHESEGPRGPSTRVQIHVHEREGKLTVATACGERARATIPPRIRREVLARDGHRCRSPGCHRAHFLEIHHRIPRSGGGPNDPANLITLCASCHRLHHEKGALVREPAAAYPAGPVTPAAHARVPGGRGASGVPDRSPNRVCCIDTRGRSALGHSLGGTIPMLKFTDSGRTVVTTPAAGVAFAWTPRGIFRSELGPAGEVAANLERHAADLPEIKRPHGVTAEVARRVKAHLRGRPDDLRDVPVDLRDQPAFGRKVLQALRRVGPGRTVSYGELAARAGSPDAARAVGRIMGANPVPLFVPCHRCLGADGSLTGFSSPGGLLLKARLLHLEGHVFDEEHERGRRHLMRSDPVMKRLVTLVGPYLPRPAATRPAWDVLMTAIIHQQLSVKAGQIIAGRVRALTPGRGFPRPDEILATDDAVLRAAGLSWAKVSFVKDLAARVADGRLKLNRLPRLDDEAATAELTAVKGIGRWSAQMHLIFHLDRLDVLPVDDVGLQNAAGRAYGQKKGLAPAKLAELGEAWRPYRSLGSWYLWRALDMGGI